MEEQAREVAELLKVLANSNRLLVLCCLMEQEMSVGEIAMQIEQISQSALSQHLSLLKAHGIIDCQKHGQSNTYFIKDNRIIAVLNTLRENYCTEALPEKAKAKPSPKNAK